MAAVLCLNSGQLKSIGTHLLFVQGVANVYSIEYNVFVSFIHVLLEIDGRVIALNINSCKVLLQLCSK